MSAVAAGLNNYTTVLAVGNSSDYFNEKAFEYIALLGISLAVVGMVTCVVAFVSVLCSPTRNNALRLGLLSLSTADFLIALSCAGLLGFDYHWHLSDHWSVADGLPIHRRETCANEVFRWLFSVSTDANLFTLIFLAAQQFVAVRWPLKSADGFSVHRSYAALGGAWAASFALSSLGPAVMAAVTDGHPDVESWPSKGSTRFCYQVVLYYYQVDERYGLAFGQVEHSWVFLCLDVAKVLIVLAALVFSYGYVIAVMGRVFKGGVRSTDGGAADRLRNRKRVVAVTVLVTGLCLGCYMPLFIHRALRDFGCTSHDPIASSAMLIVVSLAPIGDPIIYMLRLKAVRGGLRAAAARCCPIVVGRHLDGPRRRTESRLTRTTDFG